MIKFPNPLVFIILFVFITSPLRAQAASAWVKRCEGASCEIVQRLMDQESKARVLEMAVGFPAGKDSARGVVILPLGVDLSQPMSLRIDEGEPLGFKVRYCLNDGCYVFLTLPPDVLAGMKKGALGVMIFKTFDGQPGKLPLSLEGFAATLSEIQK